MIRLKCGQCGEINNCDETILRKPMDCGGCGHPIDITSYPQLVELRNKQNAQLKAVREQRKREKQEHARKAKKARAEIQEQRRREKQALREGKRLALTLRKGEEQLAVQEAKQAGCRVCGLLVSKEAKACPHCGAPKPVPKPPPRFGAEVFAGVVGFVLILFIVHSMIASSESSLTGRNKANGLSGSRNEARLSGGGWGSVTVAASEDDFDRLTQLSVADDTEGISLMISTRRLWTVPSGAKCRVIDRGLFKTEIRILEGPHMGQSGWVASERVRR